MPHFLDNKRISPYNHRRVGKGEEMIQLGSEKRRHVMKRYLVAAVQVILLISLVACLEPAKRPFYEGIDLQSRIDNQQRRIDEDISLGELARPEAEIVQENLNWIKQEYARAKYDGRISGEEWNRIEQYLDQNSKMITEKKDNPVKRLFSSPYQPPQVISIQDRISNQQQRIDRGIATGELTLREAEIIQGNLTWIKGEYAKMKAEKSLTDLELKQIGDMLEQNSNMIYNKKHNPVRSLY